MRPRMSVWIAALGPPSTARHETVSVPSATRQRKHSAILGSVIEYQRLILADGVRNANFERALTALIEPNVTTVADIGSGTGFLSFLALRLGAASATLYEQSDLLALSRELAKSNGITGCRFIRKHSRDVRNPERCSLVLSETLGNFAYEEGIIETCADARKRFLLPGGALCPSAIRQCAAPVVSPKLFHDLSSWDRIGYALDFRPARDITMQNLYVRALSRDDLLPGGAQQWDEVLLGDDDRSVRTGHCTWRLDTETSVYGFGLWWTADLAPGVVLSTNPAGPKTHWEQIYLPVLTPLACQRGDDLRLSIRSDTRPQVKIRVQWDVTLLRSGKTVVQQKLDMWKGMVE